MASHFKLHCLFYLGLLGPITVSTVSSCSGTGNSEHELHGPVGGHVVFHCPTDKMWEFCYLQRDNDYVNGFHQSKTWNKTWGNTRAEKNGASVLLFGLNVSHSGNYQLFYQYTPRGEVCETKIHLCVTANYSKPTCAQVCNDSCCNVTCTSHGGYPLTEMTWNVSEPAGSQMWKVLRSTENTDPTTKLYNVSSTAVFNCSHGEFGLIHSSVKDATSDTFSVCKSKGTAGITRAIVVIVCILVALLITALIIVQLIQRKKRENTTERIRGTLSQEIISLG